MKNTLVEGNQHSFSALEHVLRTSWVDNVTLVGGEIAPKNGINALFTFCPMYARSPLEQSELLTDPVVENSRVDNKWKAIQAIIGGIKDWADTTMTPVTVTSVFANRGVLLGHKPVAADVQALIDHDTTYRKLVRDFCEQKGIEHEYTSFEELGVTLPQFVDLEGALPVEASVKNESGMLEVFNAYARHLGLGHRINVINNKHARKRIAKIMHMWLDREGQLKPGAFESTFWLVAGYLMFDHLIPDILSDKSTTGLYLVTERFEPLFGIAEFTEELKNIPRVNIKA